MLHWGRKGKIVHMPPFSGITPSSSGWEVEVKRFFDTFGKVSSASRSGSVSLLSLAPGFCHAVAVRQFTYTACSLGSLVGGTLFVLVDGLASVDLAASSIFWGPLSRFFRLGIMIKQSLANLLSTLAIPLQLLIAITTTAATVPMLSGTQNGVSEEQPRDIRPIGIVIMAQGRSGSTMLGETFRQNKVSTRRQGAWLSGLCGVTFLGPPCRDDGSRSRCELVLLKTDVS